MKMNTNLKRLLAIGTLTSIKEIYMGTFMSARIYELSSSSIQTIAIYYIITYICIVATFFILGNQIKSKPLKVLRIGIMLNFAFLTLIMLTDEKIINYYIILAIILGISQGAYYSPYAVLIGIYNDNTVRYCTVSNILANIVSVIFPITIGLYINTTSFVSVTACMLIISTIQIIISFKVDGIFVDSKFDVKSFVKQLKKSKDNTKVFNYYKIGFFNGIVTTVLDTTVIILIMIVFGSTLQLGILNTVFAIFTMVTAYLMNKFYKKQKAKPMVIISAIIPMMAVMLLCISTNTTTVIIYKAINSIFICILTLIASIERYDCLDEKTMKKFTTEHQALAELSLAAGRNFGLVILLFVSNLIEGLYAIIIMLIIINIAIFAYAYLIKKQ